MALSSPELEPYWGWRSWVAAANVMRCDFPLQNLPFCIFSVKGDEPTIGVGIGDSVLDLAQLASSGRMESLGPDLVAACATPTLNALMACGREGTSLLRRVLITLLAEGAEAAGREATGRCLLPMQAVRYHLPVQVGDYTDFYASIHHATNVGSIFRPEQPLLPNYKFVPIGYHGRASSLVVSGHPVRRPAGQIKPSLAGQPTYSATGQLDFEVEIGAYVGRGNPLGDPVPITEAESYLFGISLLNDWSARDIQAWEYQPLGPFLGKSFATTVSPWVVAMDALEPFRVPLAEREAGDPDPLTYLTSPDRSRSGIDMEVEAYLSTAGLRAASEPPTKLSSGNLRDLYWSFAQMLTHHTSNGCNLRVGDLLGSGTISGSREGTQGSLLEITRRGAAPLQLLNGESRTFLEDGDEIILRGFCERPGLPRIGLGECRGTVVPALVRRAQG